MHESLLFQSPANSGSREPATTEDSYRDKHVRQPSHICYTSSVTVVASRELRNQTRALLDRVDAGETITISVDGREVAELRPIARQRTWMKRPDFVARILATQADPALRHELRELTPDTTDDLKWQ